MRLRTKAREVALQYLYQIDITRVHTENSLNEFILHFVSDKRIIPYAEKLVDGVYTHLDDIDILIESVSENWTVLRMPSIDKNILRISVYELMYRPDIPYKVAINEGIELAKRFGSPNFPPFVNGVLDKIKNRVKDQAE